MRGVLDLRRLRVVREIARTGSFSAAAQQLSFSPSAVSQQVAALERQLELVLFERGGTGVRLTEAGVKLVAQGYVAAVGDLTLIPRLAVDVLRSGLVTRPVIPSLSRRVSILSRAHRPLSAALIDLVEELRDACHRAEATLTAL